MGVNNQMRKAEGTVLVIDIIDQYDIAMSNPQFLSLDAAFAATQNRFPFNAVCPHCGAFTVFQPGGAMGIVPQGEYDGKRISSLSATICPGCHEIGIGVQLVDDDRKTSAKLLWPNDSLPNRAPVDVNSEIKKAYNEARQIISISPQSAAVLARRCVQHVIREKLGIKERTLFVEIAKAIQRSELSKPTRDSLDHVRQIGNWGAHPSESETDPANTIIEVSRAEAEYTIRVLEMLFRDLYELPAEAAQMDTLIQRRK